MNFKGILYFSILSTVGSTFVLAAPPASCPRVEFQNQVNIMKAINTGTAIEVSIGRAKPKWSVKFENTSVKQGENLETFNELFPDSKPVQPHEIKPETVANWEPVGTINGGVCTYNMKIQYVDAELEKRADAAANPEKINEKYLKDYWERGTMHPGVITLTYQEGTATSTPAPTPSTPSAPEPAKPVPHEAPEPVKPASHGVSEGSSVDTAHTAESGGAHAVSEGEKKKE